MGRDRRRFPRVGVSLDARVEALGIEWQVRTMDLSPYGVRIALPARSVKPPAGTRAQIRLTLPDGGPPLRLQARVVRCGSDQMAFDFVDLEDRHFQRLAEIVDSLLKALSDDSLPAELDVRPVKDRRKARRLEVELDINFDGEHPRYWQGKTLNLSPSGVKVAWPQTAIQPLWGTPVRLRLAVRDGGPPIAAQGIVWRREPEALVLLLVGLRPEDRERLRSLVESPGAPHASLPLGA